MFNANSLEEIVTIDLLLVGQCLALAVTRAAMRTSVIGSSTYQWSVPKFPVCNNHCNELKR